MSLTNSSRIAAPLSFAASQFFEGNDGKWSSFVVRVGTPEQIFRILPSTVTSETFVPLVGACKEDYPANCSVTRGIELRDGEQSPGFDAKASQTWHEIGIYGIAGRDELGYNASGLYGLDNLGLMIANSGGPTLQKQVIGGVVNPRIWLGRLGLDVKPSNFSEFDNPQRSLIPTLKQEGYIPSESYSYTAGAYYKQPTAVGSLIFGGFDQKRFEPNSITFPFDANDSRKPSLHIQSIVGQTLDNQTLSLLQTPVYTLIDFAESQLWLPVSACDAFAKAFNLTYDETTDLYLVDADTRERLRQRNPTITFGLGQTPDPGGRVNIVLPYRAFDQQASFPLYENTTNYFPIRRAHNDTQYTLGRAFFQEAYIRVDYERGNFSVHQALFPTANEQEIVEIKSKEANVEQHTGSSALSKGAVAGISVSSFFAFVCIIIVLSWVFRRRRVTPEESNPVPEEVRIECADEPRLETDGVAFYEKECKTFAEMEGSFLPELPSLDLGIGELNVRLTQPDMSMVFELADEEWMGQFEEEIHVVMPCKSKAPPGWI